MKKSFSVKEMYTMLGISKVSGYDLIKQGLFDVVVIAKHTRVLTESFEKWYANQFYYHKVNGESPGQALRNKYLTKKELQNILGIAKSTAEDLILSGRFKTEPADHRLTLISRKSFERWYSGQVRYHKVNGEPPGKRLPPVYSQAEVRKIMGYNHRNDVYELIKRTHIKTYHSDSNIMIDKLEFDTWYKNRKTNKEPSD